MNSKTSQDGERNSLDADEAEGPGNGPSHRHLLSTPEDIKMPKAGGRNSQFYSTQGAGNFFSRRNLENSVLKPAPQRGVDYYYKHIKTEAAEEIDESALPAATTSFSKKLKPHERKRYGNFIPIS